MGHMPATPPVVPPPFTRIFNVRDYGAVGDGVTDDTAAIQRAFDAASNLDVLFPANLTYLVSAPLTKASGRLRIHGEGATIKLAASFPAQLESTGVIDARTMDELSVSGLSMDGNSTALNGGAGFPDWLNFIQLVYAVGVDVVRLRDCTLTNYPSGAAIAFECGRVAFEGNHVSDGMFHGLVAQRCDDVSAVRNAFVGRGDVGADATIGGIGIHFIDCDYVDASGNHVSDASDTGLKGQGCSYVTCERNTVERSGKDGIKWQGTDTGSSANPAPTFVRVANNAVSVLNAWRSDGSSLILIADYQGAYIGGNQLRGGGTRATDGIRVALVASAEQQRYIIEGNLGESIEERALNIEQIRDLVVRGNRFDANFDIRFSAGEVLIEGNTITNGGTIDSARNGIGVTDIRSGSVIVRGNTVAEHLTGIATHSLAGGTIEEISIVNNLIRTCHQFGIRADNFGASNTNIRVLEIRGNLLRDTCAGVSSSAAIRIGTSNLTIALARIAHNTVQNLTANTIGVWLELTGASANKIAVLDVTGVHFVGVTNAWAITNQDRASRILGWRANAAPTFGTWARGDIVQRQSPSAAGEWGYICIADGSPGTWTTLREVTPTELVAPQITANQNDYTPAGLANASVLIITSDAARDITGFGSEAANRTLYVYNNGAFNITLKHLVTSTAAKQIVGRGNADTVLTPKTGALLFYSPSITKWLVLGDTL